MNRRRFLKSGTVLGAGLVSGALSGPRVVASPRALEILSAGDYDIVAVVNERFTSGPYPLTIVRPDLEAYGRESTIPGRHRRFDGENLQSFPGRGSERSRDRRGFRAGREEGDRS